MGKAETKVSDARKRSHNFKDLTGQKFNRLLVLNFAYIKNRNTYWKCKCDCGNIIIVNSGHLKDNHTKSCGCLKKENIKKRIKEQTKHNLRHTRIYGIWVNMKTRCYNTNNEDYKNYGGRGIVIYKKWIDKENGFINFYNWAMENGYRDNLTIDRIDVNGNYEPSNCRWVDWIRQQNNRRNNHIIEYKKEKHTLEEWSKILPINISSSVLRYRIIHDWGIERAFTTPVRRLKKDERRNNVTK